MRWFCSLPVDIVDRDRLAAAVAGGSEAGRRQARRDQVILDSLRMLFPRIRNSTASA